MKFFKPDFLGYTAAIVFVFLLLTNWKGANALLGTLVGGYVSGVTALEGRNKPK